MAVRGGNGTEARRQDALARYRVLDTPPEAAFDEMVELAATTCRTPMAILSFIDAERQWFKASKGLELAATARDISFCTHTIGDQHSMVVPDALRDERFARNPLVSGAPNVRFYAGTPLVASDGACIGTLAVLDTRPRRLRRHQMRTLESLAGLAMERLERRLDEIHLQERLAQEHLRASEERFRSLLEHIPDVVVLYGPDLRIRYINRATTAVTGLEPEAFIGKRDDELFSPEQHRPVLDLLHRARETRCSQSATVDLELPRTGMRYLEITCLPIINDDGTLRDILGVTRDLTEQRSRERQLSEQSRLLEIASRVARLGGWRADLATKRVSWSEQVAAIHEEPPGTAPTVEQGIHYYAAEHRERIREVFEDCAARGVPYDEELQILTARGRRLWVRVIGEPERDESGRIVAVHGAFLDISERKEAEEKQRRSEEGYRSLFQHHPDAVFSVDLDGCFAAGNRAAGALVGGDGNDLAGRHFGEFIASHDRGRADAAFQAVLQGQPVNLYATLVGRDGSELDAFFTVDRYWRYTFVNREAQRLMQRERDALLGQEVWTVFPELGGTRVEKEYYRAMQERRPVRFEYFFPPYQQWFHIRVYPVEDGLAVYFQDNTERKRAEQEIEFLAMYDPLTRLPNRRLLDDRLERALAGALRDGLRGAALFVDLDNFKVLNDTLGHHQGDVLLQQSANRLNECVRARDTVARFGGDEFMVIVNGLGNDACTAARQARRVGEKIIARLSEPFELGGQDFHSAASVGIAIFGKRNDRVNDAVKCADIALHQAKEAGRRTLRVFDPAMQARLDSRAALETELRVALAKGEIRPYFQPQFDHQGRLIGAEALARWVHPDRGLIAPDQFIPVAEESGLILELGRSMLDGVCERLARWSGRPLAPEFCVSVNVSAREFHHPGFVEEVLRILEQSGARPECLQLELTESSLLQDIADTTRKMESLKEWGISFSLDDFGTGYSSLFYLKQLPLDQIKIDQGFVRDMLCDSSDSVIVRAVIGLAANLGLAVIAEGVENEAVKARLAEYGCYNYQGYLFSRPVPVEEFEALLAPSQEQRV